jgi:hypothetical protein
MRRLNLVVPACCAGFEPYSLSGSRARSITVGGACMIVLRANFHALCTIQESDRSSRVASSVISFKIGAEKWTLCLRLSVSLIEGARVA